MRTTRDAPLCASASQSTVEPGWPGARCPLTTVTAWLSPRWVTGTPAAAGTASAEETPGTTVQGTPASAQATASSPPRPNRYGSPPLRRTTRLPARASRTSSASISAWSALCAPGALPTYTTRAAGRAQRDDLRRDEPVDHDHVRCRSSSRPRTVSSPGSPGPAPTSTTEPGGLTRRGSRGTGAATATGTFPVARRASAVRAPPARLSVRRAGHIRSSRCRPSGRCAGLRPARRDGCRARSRSTGNRRTRAG